MAAMISLDAIERGLQSFLDSLKAASLCCKTGASIIKLKESVGQISKEAETLRLVFSDLLEYKRQLQACTGILTELEVPSQELNEMSETLKAMLNQVVSEQRLTSGLLSSLMSQFNKMSDTAKEIGKGINEFKNAVARVREFCTKTMQKCQDGARAAEKELKDEASSERKTGIIEGSALAGIGAGFLALSILGICTGGVGLVVAGVAGVAAGGGAIMGGGVVAVDAVLSASELDRKAAKFRGAVKRMELAKMDVERLEQDMENGVIRLTEEMIKSLETGLAVFGRMEAAVQRSEQLQTKVDTLEDEIAKMKRELEELRMHKKE